MEGTYADIEGITHGGSLAWSAKAKMGIGGDSCRGWSGIACWHPTRVRRVFILEVSPAWGVTAKGG